MILTSVVGYPRIGRDRELKKLVEDYLRGRLSSQELRAGGRQLREAHWSRQREKGIDWIPSNDFSYYDTVLDLAMMLNAIPERYREIGGDDLDVYFAMARGCQDARHDLKALELKKWFNTNYHYIVPEIDAAAEFKLNAAKTIEEYEEARLLGIKTKPVLVGAYTFLRLARVKPAGKDWRDYLDPVAGVYGQLLQELAANGVELVQLDEPGIVLDLNAEERAGFLHLYRKILRDKSGLRVLLQTYFGDVRDIYQELITLDFDAVGLDFVEGAANIALVEQHGFPADKELCAGVVNARNVWRNDYRKTLAILAGLAKHVDPQRLVLGTSCSLLHVPYTAAREISLREEDRRQLAFAEEKLDELIALRDLFAAGDYAAQPLFRQNQALMTERAMCQSSRSAAVRERVRQLTAADWERKPAPAERAAIQRARLNLPLLPTTTIGSFPQTQEIRRLRREFKQGRLTREAYAEEIRAQIRRVIAAQESIGLDVLVHGEFERNDMVEYFGENLAGFLFTEYAWVQSYGTRCVKPPIIFGDVERFRPLTVEWIAYAQSLTAKPVKGMLTGPVTILNWSFPREDLSLGEICFQIALAIRDEVMALEAAGIRIIQIDEAAFREKLPLRKADWGKDYLAWAIPAFRLVHAGVKPETQIHTHMCYSDFTGIMREIEALDADVISFEAARSDLAVLDALQEHGFERGVGPGVYDIHSPRVPGEEELVSILDRMVEKLGPGRLWVNPDCGLKTRGEEETWPSLANMVRAARRIRVRLDPGASEGDHAG